MQQMQQMQQMFQNMGPKWVQLWLLLPNSLKKEENRFDSYIYFYWNNKLTKLLLYTF